MHLVILSLSSLSSGIIYALGIFSGSILFLILTRIGKRLGRTNIRNIRKQHEIILNSVPDFIYIKDTQSRFVAANIKLLQVFNFKKYSEIIGKTDADLYPGKFAEKFLKDEIEILKTGVPLLGEIEQALNENKELIYLSTSKYPIFNKKKKIIGIIGIGRDITKQIEFEQKLIEANTELKKVNDQLSKKKEYIDEQSEQLKAQAEELEYANEQLTEFIKTRDRFFSIIAHDLKNPVNLLRGFAELLLYRYNDLNEERRIKYIETLYKTTTNLVDLLEKLLQWASMQTGGIRFEPVVINNTAFIEENLEPLRESFEKKNIKVETNISQKDVLMVGDRNMLDFIFRNLVTNAIKYTYRDGTINISFNIKDHMAEFCISDNGVGIDDNLFKNLFSLSRNTTKEGTEGESGSGLGLFLCKDFIERNRGKIWCKSTFNVGTSFYFEIPLAANSNN